MSGTLMVSVSGVRGLVGDGLTPEVACAFASALGSHLGASAPGRPVLISRDGRPSGEALRHAVIAGLLGTGCDVRDVGIQPTPTAGRAVRELGCAGGIQITASHNPAPWNGLKMFGPDGAVLDADEGAKVRDRFAAKDFATAGWDGVGRERDAPDVGGEHLDAVVAAVGRPPVILKPFIDANGGAGGPLALRLVEALGCDEAGTGLEPTGRFAHEPEPTPDHLAEVAPLVRGHHVGFALDPDADRLALIDETGRCLSEELTLALAVKFALARRPGPVVVNMSTSRVVEDVAAAFGCECHRSAVGEANVVGLMRRVGATIGGEGNGGVIDPRIGWVRDPFVGMAMILNLLAESGEPLSRLADRLPAYAMLKHKVGVEPGRLPALLAALKSEWPGAAVNELDGLRLDWPDRWLHVRASNTEPIVRLIAEAPTAGGARGLIDRAGELAAGQADEGEGQQAAGASP